MYKPDLKEKTQQKNNKRKNKIRFYYSFLTIVLLICLVQIGFSAFNNITKSKIFTLVETLNQTPMHMH